MNKEIWKDIKDYNGLYQISNLGRVKSLGNSATRKEKIRKLKTDKKGYYIINLFKNGKTKNYRVHRLVAEAFIPNPENKPEIDHINTIRCDNRVENLRWVTPKENKNNPLTIDKMKTSQLGSKHWKSKPIIQYSMNGDIVNIWESSMIIERTNGWANSHIWSACRDNNKTAYNHKWRYLNDQLADWLEEIQNEDMANEKVA